MSRPEAATIRAGDEWRAAASGRVRESLDPSTGAVLAEFADGGADDVDQAVQAATAAFESAEWRDLTPDRRARLLFAFADAVERDADELTRLESLDVGQPYWNTRGSVESAVAHLRYFAGWVTKVDAPSAPLSVPGVLQRSVRLPLGVCGLITPWNFPLLIAVWKVAPALATGNTVVIKPAEQTPLTTVRLAELAGEAGLPPGVLNVVTGGPEAGEALVRHPGVAKVSFTGSTEVGRRIGAIAGERLTRVSLELGGKTPSIVTPHADLGEAIAGNAGGAFYNTGQTCAAFSRLYVHRSRVEELVEGLVAAARSWRIGPGSDAETQAGPLVSAEHRKSVEAYVAAGRRQGATVAEGGVAAEPAGFEQGFYYRPTILVDVSDEMSVAREEIFGPVLSVLTYDDEDEVVHRANASPFGLAAAVWSREIKEAHRLAERLRTGTVWQNTTPVLDAASPWGGFKSSGVGREMAWDAVLAYTDVKSVITDLSR